MTVNAASPQPGAPSPAGTDLATRSPALRPWERQGAAPGGGLPSTSYGGYGGVGTTGMYGGAGGMYGGVGGVGGMYGGGSMYGR